MSDIETPVTERDHMKNLIEIYRLMNMPELLEDMKYTWHLRESVKPITSNT